MDFICAAITRNPRIKTLILVNPSPSYVRGLFPSLPNSHLTTLTISGIEQNLARDLPGLVENYFAQDHRFSNIHCRQRETTTVIEIPSKTNSQALTSNSELLNKIVATLLLTLADYSKHSETRCRWSFRNRHGRRGRITACDKVSAWQKILEPKTLIDAICNYIEDESTSGGYNKHSFKVMLTRNLCSSLKIDCNYLSQELFLSSLPSTIKTIRSLANRKLQPQPARVQLRI